MGLCTAPCSTDCRRSEWRIVVVKPFWCMMEQVKWGWTAAARRRRKNVESLLPPLAHGLVQADGAGHADVQALDRAQHGDVDQLVAGFAGQAAHALAFRAHYPGHRLARVDRMQAVAGLVVGAHHPDAALLQ